MKEEILKILHEYNEEVLDDESLLLSHECIMKENYNIISEKLEQLFKKK